MHEPTCRDSADPTNPANLPVFAPTPEQVRAATLTTVLLLQAVADSAPGTAATITAELLHTCEDLLNLRPVEVLEIFARAAERIAAEQTQPEPEHFSHTGKNRCVICSAPAEDGTPYCSGCEAFNVEEEL